MKLFSACFSFSFALPLLLPNKLEPDGAGSLLEAEFALALVDEECCLVELGRGSELCVLFSLEDDNLECPLCNMREAIV